jgi:hypothetical protein
LHLQNFLLIKPPPTGSFVKKGPTGIGLSIVILIYLQFHTCSSEVLAFNMAFEMTFGI